MAITKNCEKMLKKMLKRFGGLKKVRIFAARLRENGPKSSLKRLKTVQEASTEKNNLSRSVDSFEELRET